MGNKANESAILGTFAVGLAVDIIIAIVMVVIHSLLIFKLSTYCRPRPLKLDSMKLSARAVMKTSAASAHDSRQLLPRPCGRIGALCRNLSCHTDYYRR